ncbi:P-loop NTPase family protein [Convivina praedatoris]|nr:zeta toxin family protein [Convivina sp. LMG 32447]
MAERIQKILEHKNCFVIHQDVVRKEILHTHDHYNNPAISLIEELAEYGLKNYPVTVIEGILRKDVYGEMLTELLSSQHIHAIAIYLDMPFSITVKNDKQKPHSFGESILQKWWREQDKLSEEDLVIKSDSSMDLLINKIRKIAGL